MAKYKLSFILLATVALLLLGLIIGLKSGSKPHLATVLSVDPIIVTQVIENEHCDIAGFIGPFNRDHLARYHPAEKECEIFYMIEKIQGVRMTDYPKRQFSHCIITQQNISVIIGYDVIYRIGDTLGKVRSPYDPGTFIPLDEKGQLILDLPLKKLCENAIRNKEVTQPFYCLSGLLVANSLEPVQSLKILPAKTYH
ncbi:UmoD family flagellar biogenesis regulator [Moellerella wisconsensis]|uniref:Uncharacterized protein n=2 Tax=Moellerella wisconsensis TaxID=158849 RepID=A0ACD3Y3M7_9GAMM|nr:UmoD family flagellar biogenesis regulator [Moellerella wisconsensis]KLN95946.1 hypothetical protein VK86_12435 [Moellerella wisconsensis]UNH23046.1 hypothetical protein MNY68_09265 [Moellerella wisconsensis]UNH26164.1 hypothetical protein MNY64_09720 [Moellerella wisconsensis]UNH29583.1 hypothetical protein MNY72_09305 [Moellerella wisconsensis]UNH37722.1 hypothetical protein MNY70_09320 [Moellerella wisconsensis]